MIRYLTIAAALCAAPALAQTPAGGVVGMGASPAPYTPAGTIPPPGTTPSGLGTATSPGTPGTPALPQPSTGVTPPIGAANAGTIGDGRVGTVAPGVSTSATTTSTTPPK